MKFNYDSLQFGSCVCKNDDQKSNKLSAASWKKKDAGFRDIPWAAKNFGTFYNNW